MFRDLPEALILYLWRNLNIEVFENLHKFCLPYDLHMIQELLEGWAFL